jgi:hypothetical protein
MRTHACLPIAVAGLALLACLAGSPAVAQPAGKAPQAHETSIDGVTSEIVEAVRKEGVLTLKVRYRNTGASPAQLEIYHDWSESGYYLTSGSSKFLILRDSKGAPLAVPHSTHGGTKVEIKPKSSFLFWAKFPAPPAEAKKVTFFNPHTPPIEDIPIAEAQ